MLEAVTKHETTVHELKVRYNYTYDHVGRPKEVKQKIYVPGQNGTANPAEQEKIVSRYHYNELGQVTQKQLHSENDGVTFLQDVDFRYNVRGWLTHINDSELTDTRDVFGMELSYETGFEEVQHNGNISGVKWKSATNNVERSYGFAYDKLGRLKRANFHAKDEQTGAWTAENENYTVWNLDYDLDGNILSVKRNGLQTEDPQGNKTFGLIDDLTYSYRRLQNRGKTLMKVEDAATLQTASKDFKNGNTAGDDYEYNEEGSITRDKNKGVSFQYNHLGRVNKIINTANTSDKLDYLYDATGSKLQKIVKEGTRTKKIDYVNGFQYRNDTLDFFPMPEGRIVFRDGEYIPEYHFKDHLGNLRLAFQVTDRQNARYSLTMEADSAASEEKEFENVKEARTDLKEQKGKFSARLTNADKAISKTIKVKKGDQISAFVFATNDPEIAQTDSNKPIAQAEKDLLLSLGSAAVGVINTNPTQQEIDIPLNPEISPAQTIITKSPKVQLNLLDFVPVVRNLRKLNRAKRAKSLAPNMFYVPRGELVLQLKDSVGNLLEERREKITISAVTAWQELAADFVAKEEGEVTVFIDNSDTEPVYFDNLELRVESDPTLVITQEHHYYPFGMNLSGIERQGDLMYQFNGMIEKEQAFGLELYETPFRSYDAQLGRFWQVEPLADIYCSVSVFQFGFNNPISFNDPMGLNPKNDPEEDPYVAPGWMEAAERNPVRGSREYDYSYSSGGDFQYGRWNGYTIWGNGSPQQNPYSNYVQLSGAALGGANAPKPNIPRIGSAVPSGGMRAPNLGGGAGRAAGKVVQEVAKQTGRQLFMQSAFTFMRSGVIGLLFLQGDTDPRQKAKQRALSEYYDNIYYAEQSAQEGENGEKYVTIYKAPSPGMGQKLFTNGLQTAYFPYNPPFQDGNAYFAAPGSRKVAEHWNRIYNEGILEITMPLSDYKKHYAKPNLVRKYRAASPDMGVNPFELLVPPSMFSTTNTYPRILLPN